MFAQETIHPDTWPAIHRILAPAMVRANYGATELIDHLLADTARLWVLRKGGDPIAAAVSDLEPTPRGLVVHCRLLAGSEMHSWLGDALETGIAHARELNACGIELSARKGLARLLARHGFSPRSVNMRLLLEGAT